MEIKSQSRFIRVTPRKARLVASAVRHLPLERALATLNRLPKRAAGQIKKTIESGIANAENNAKLSRNRLFIKALTVDEGPRFKRWRAAARGVAHPYQKQTSHITVILDEMEVSEVPVDTKQLASGKTTAQKTEPKKEEKKVVKAKKGYEDKIESETKMKSQDYGKKTTLTRKVIGK